MSEQEFTPREWLSSKEAADLTGYSRHAFIKAKDRGLISSIKIGNMLFYKRADILEYVERMKVLGPQKHDPRRHRH